MIECGIGRHYPSRNSDGICINGGVYYIARFYRDDDHEPDLAIVCFDVRLEKYRVINEAEDMHLLGSSTVVNYKAGEDELYIVGVVGGTDEVVLWPESVNPLYVYYYNMERNTFRRVEIKGMEAVSDYTKYMTLDYVEDVKLMKYV
ncbi:unnamed protein product [Microthlaspi erraticum]|uniref:F-box associated beta-propeller type 3 domain-containing protein n=1 Tax=Microthlaspi erraticum TaxID=1685480 RepID=A0A6D2I508_9BRAS|nr:unnamed protein product [Microthlaspi erraticum]